jgi:hypothetical protein
MSTITLFCEESNGLTLGPGDKGSPRVIQFANHYADLDTDDPLFDEKMSWVNTRGCPHIEVMDTDEAKVTDPDAFPCPICDKAFTTKKARDMHQIAAHRNRG